MPIPHSPSISITTFISLHRIALLISIILLTACAMSPQTVYIKPDLKVPSMPIGHGRPLAVETHDLRHNPTLALMGTVEGNRRLINETVSQALNQIFLDSKLQRFLSR